MYDFSNMAIIVGVFFWTTISPGPATFATATYALSMGRRKAIAFSAGLTIGHMIWGSLVVGTLIMGSEKLAAWMRVIAISGGLYFLWLAYQSFRAALQQQRFEKGAGIGQHIFWKGIALNLLNPTIVVIWMSVLALGPDQFQRVDTLGILFIACIVTAFASYWIVAWVFSLSEAMSIYRRISRWVNGCAGAVYAAASIGMLSTAF